MTNMKLKNKLILMALSMVLFVMIVSTLVVCIIVYRQNQSASTELLKKSFTIVSDNISEMEDKLLGDSRRMLATNDMTSTIKYLVDYNTKVDEEVVGNTYKEVAQRIYNFAKMGNIWKVAIYNADGDLVAFSTINDNGAVLGYAHRFPRLTFGLASLTSEQQLKNDLWKAKENLPGDITLKFEKSLSHRETTHFEHLDSFICLVTSVPVIAGVYEEKTGKVRPKQVALVTTIRKLDNAFASKASRLTGTNINIYVRDGFSVGNMPEYKVLNLETIEQSSEDWSMSKQQILFNDIAMKNDSYFQAIFPLYGDSRYVGAIASLYSKSIARNNSWQMIKLLSLVSLLCILIILPVTIIFSSLISRPINKVITRLTEVSEQVVSASTQVSSASHSLAEGASEQASSLQETSSSLEELSSMTKQNADHAEETENLSSDSIDNLKSANVSMKSLMKSMEETSQASGNVAKIIKTIDEIAFQTNLLALNAAVEAARAGEAGSGFAVVAGEVRNLALRSAQASENTRQLVEDIIQKIDAGSALVRETDDRYRSVALNVQKVTQLVKEISAASHEQAQGIEQINRAVAEVEKVTQRSAANAEEGASASEVMNAQAGGMEHMAVDLLAIVGGTSSQKTDKRTFSA